MVGRTKPITKADRKRFEALRNLGCIACRLDGFPGIPAEIHHITDCGRRMGHQYSIPLCVWQHRGVAESIYDHFKGPSLALSKRDFVERYGTELELLAKVNRMIGAEQP